MALKDGLIRYWKLNETTGTSVIDTMGNNNGSLSGSYTLNQTGIKNGAVYFFGGLANLGQLPAGYGSNSVSFWFNVTAFVGGHVDMIAQFGWTDYFMRVYFHDYLSPANALVIENSGASAYNVGYAPTTGSWYHIVVTNSGTSSKAYVNGNLVTTQYATSYSPGAYNGSSIGQGWQYGTPDGAPANGRVDEVAVWNRALSDAEVTTLYNSGAGYEIPFAVIYTLTAVQTSFSLTGYAALFHKYLKLVSAQGSFLFTGQNILFHKIIKILLSVGNYSLTGINIILVKGKVMLISAGSFAISGSNILYHRLMKIALAPGAFSLTGQNSILRKVKILIAEFGSYTITGQDSLFHRLINLVMSPGSFSLTGENVTINKVMILLASVGNYLFTGKDSLFHRYWKAGLSFSSYSLSGFSLLMQQIKQQVGIILGTNKNTNIVTGVNNKVPLGTNKNTNIIIGTKK